MPSNSSSSLDKEDTSETIASSECKPQKMNQDNNLKIEEGFHDINQCDNMKPETTNDCLGKESNTKPEENAAAKIDPLERSRGIKVDVDSKNLLPTEMQNASINSEETTDKPPLPDVVPSTNKGRSVNFAPTNKVRQFDNQSPVTTLLHGEEGQIESQNNVSVLRNSRRRRLAASNRGSKNAASKEEANGKSMKVESVWSLLDKDEDDASNSVQYLHNSLFNNQTAQSKHGKKKTIQIALLHSHTHTQIIHQAMEYIHQDRDILLDSLLKWCGIFRGAGKNGPLSSFLNVVAPKIGRRKLLEMFHDKDYLDLLEFTLKEEEEEDVTDNDVTNSDDETINDEMGFNGSSMSVSNDEQTEKEDEDDSCMGAFLSHFSMESSEEPQLELPCTDVLAKYGLEDDCPYPTTKQAHVLLWKYCLAISGASWHAASLLTANTDTTKPMDVAIHWGGGRHHAHPSKAGGFCYVSDVVLAIMRLVHDGHGSNVDDGMLGDTMSKSHRSIPRGPSIRRILYLDIDIHHGDAVQAAFYSTDRVLTASFHRHSPGFFPASSGSINEKGEVDTNGFGYNLNVPLPAGMDDVQFIEIYRKALFGLVNAYDPHAIVLCVGADGLEGDELVSGGLDSEVTGEGWMLSPEGLAECVRMAAALCAGLNEEAICKPAIEKQKEDNVAASELDHPNSDSGRDKPPPAKKGETRAHLGPRRKLLLLGGGGYTPAQTAKTYLLCTAAACEGARPGMYWSDLPRDIPNHDYFPRYGPSFELVSGHKKEEILGSYSCANFAEAVSSDVKEGPITEFDSSGEEESDADKKILREAHRAIELTTLYIERQRNKEAPQRSNFSYEAAMSQDEEMPMLDVGSRRKKKSSSKGGGRRHKKKKTV